MLPDDGFDAKLRWAVIAGMGVVVIAVAAVWRLPLAAGELAVWLMLIGAALAAGRWIGRRGWGRTAFTLGVLAQVLAFGCVATALMCLATMAGRPLVDADLLRADAWLRLDVPALMAWSRRHPVVDGLLTAAYHTIQVQTLVVVGVLGLRGERRPLDDCLLSLILAGLLTLVLFVLFPAAGPFTEAGYGFAPSAYQQHYLDNFHGYRSGRLAVVAFYNREGLIVFPSFHTAWAAILATAWVHRPVAFAVFGLLNLAVMVSTMTTGMHYAADVLAGLAVALAAVVLVRFLRRAPARQDLNTR